MARTVSTRPTVGIFIAWTDEAGNLHEALWQKNISQKGIDKAERYVGWQSANFIDPHVRVYTKENPRP